MAQNENNSGIVVFGIIAAGFLIALIFALFIIEIAAIAFAIFWLFVLNWRYTLICGAAGFATVSVLNEPVQRLISKMYQQFDMGMLVWAFHLAPWALMAIGFIVACLLLDFINDQRNQPTSKDDLLAWRIKWGFTKGLDLTKSASPQRMPPANVFDVPPQDRT